MADKEDRTETATGRRLQRARDEGQVALSPELAAVFLLAGATVLLIMRAPADIRRLCSELAGLLAAAGRLDGTAGIGAVLRQAGADMLRAEAALFGIAVLAGAAATLVQTGFLFNLDALMPDLSRLSPGRGFKRVVSLGNLAQAGKSLVKLAIVGGALWRLLRNRRDMLIGAVLRDPGHLPLALQGLAGSVLMTALAAQAVIAVVDITAVRIRHASSMRMSRAEVRDEARESDGNPQVKAKLRRLRVLRARQRVAEAMKRATVVVTNPTHYAVALEYDRSRTAAPRVIAKGVDEAAARIRTLAAENRVPLVANPPLARALHQVEIDSDIPAEHYQAVAELIAYVWRLQGQAGRRRR